MEQFDVKIRAIEKASEGILNGASEKAATVIREEYPFTPIKKETRSYTAQQMTGQFFRDGFIDRYFGTRLVNPGMLRVLSERLPEDFPYQAHWATDKCHLAYWDLQPTIDQIYPIALGGADEPSNWATTSMKGNLSKSNFTLEQLGWKLYPAGDIANWDGLSAIFVRCVKKDVSLLKVAGIAKWYKPTKRLLEGY